MPQETQNERARFACWYWLTWKKSMLWRSVTVSDCLIRVPAESCQWLPIYEYLLRAVLSEFVKHALFASLVDITCSCTMQFVGVRQQRWVGRCHDGPVSSQQTSDDAQRNTHTHLSHDQWPHANTKKLSFLLTSLDDEYDYFFSHTITPTKSKLWNRLVIPRYQQSSKYVWNVHVRKVRPIVPLCHVFLIVQRRRNS